MNAQQKILKNTHDFMGKKQKPTNGFCFFVWCNEDAKFLPAVAFRSWQLAYKHKTNFVKRTALFYSAFVLTILFTFSSCQKQTEAPASSANTTTTTTTKAVDVSGTWQVSSWLQRTEDKTSAFKDYSVTFAAGGTAKAEHNSPVDNGTWVYTPSSVSYCGSTPSKASFAINFGTAATLSTLNRTRNIDSAKTTATALALINPEPADGESLTFTKQQ